MSEPFDKYVKLRERENLPLLRSTLQDYVSKGYAECREEFIAALDAYDKFTGSPGTEADWQALENALADLQRCTEA
jgi:phosphoribulokinase